MKFIFGMQISIKVKLILSFSVCVTRHTQITQNKFAYFCNISWKALDLLPVDKHKIFLQVDSITLGVLIASHVQGIQNNIFAISQGNMKHEVDFLPTDKVRKDTSLRLRLSSKWYYYFRGMWPPSLKN